MGRLARWLFVAFALSAVSGQAVAQAAVEQRPGALERVWSVWASVEWSAPWERRGTSAAEALKLLRSLGEGASRIVLYPDLRSAIELVGWLAENHDRIVRVTAATGETVVRVVLATGETVVIVVEATGAALVLVTETAAGTLEPLGRYMPPIDVPGALEGLAAATGWASRLWTGWGLGP
jgi:hypothetical protein